MSSDDIFGDWRGKRFVIIEYSLFGRWSVILTDYEFWIDELGTLKEWCDRNGADMSGMTVEFPSEECLTLFVLTWH